MENWVDCPRCGEQFLRDEPWKKVCLDCWKKWKNTQAKGQPKSDPKDDLIVKLTRENQRLKGQIWGLEMQHKPSSIEVELQKRMRNLIFLTHPDKHGGSKLANDTTVFLLNVKEKFENSLH